MQLSKFSDYALRVLVHLAGSPDQLLSTRAIAELHGIKFNHLSKVSIWLVQEGYAEAQRGRGGGLRLAKKPADISLGEVIRKLEAEKPLVECFSLDGSGCRLITACGLAGVLSNAQEAFFQALDTQTLASVIERNNKMPALLSALHSEMVD